MIIVWSRLGFLVPVVGFGALALGVLAANAVFGEHYSRDHAWPGVVSCLVGGVAVFSLGYWLNSEEGGHTFFFIPMQYWGFAVGLLGFAMLLIDKTPRPEPATSLEMAFEPPEIKPFWKRSEIEPDGGNFPAQLAQAIERGRPLKLTPYVELYSESSPASQAFDDHLADPRVEKIMAGTSILRVNVAAWRSELAAAGFHADDAPALCEVDALGRPTGRNVSGADWNKVSPAEFAERLANYFADAPAEIAGDDTNDSSVNAESGSREDSSADWNDGISVDKLFTQPSGEK